MIEFQPYIRVDQQLEPVRDFIGPIEDPQYIEGAVRLKIDRKTVFDETDETLVDDLMSYLLTALEKLSCDDVAEFYWPGLASRFRMRPHGRDKVLIQRLNPSDAGVEIVADKIIVVDKLLAGISEFYETLFPLNPLWNPAEIRGPVDALKRWNAGGPPVRPFGAPPPH